MPQQSQSSTSDTFLKCSPLCCIKAAAIVHVSHVLLKLPIDVVASILIYLL